MIVFERAREINYGYLSSKAIDYAYRIRWYISIGITVCRACVIMDDTSFLTVFFLGWIVPKFDMEEFFFFLSVWLRCFFVFLCS